MIIHRVSITDSSEYLDDKGLAELVTQIKNYANVHGGSVTVETLKQATVDVSTYNPSNKPVISPTSPNDAMAQVEVTLSNIPVPDVVESNKAATIDVSTYDPSNKPVITPTSPNDTMAQVTVSLANIPVANGMQLYCWHTTDPSAGPSISESVMYTDFSISPQNSDDFAAKHTFVCLDSDTGNPYFLLNISTINNIYNITTTGEMTGRTSDTEFHFYYMKNGVRNDCTMTRYAAGDITSW